jgi:hypothetical protein
MSTPGAMAAPSLPKLHRFVTKLLPDAQLTIFRRLFGFDVKPGRCLFWEVFNTNVEMPV